ncbi:MAG: hypothetical protein R3217_03780 [Gammaproteobacteria bacterium]|nr:hypothetical protein [Gammaproteobacteria bacterium]
MFAPVESFLLDANSTLVVVLSLLWALFSLVLLSLSLRDGRLLRIIAGTMTERVASATQGYTELHGKAVLLKGPVIRSPGGRACAWYRTWHTEPPVTAEDERSVFMTTYKHTPGQLQNYKNTMFGESSDELFGIDDGTGICIIDPEDAGVLPSARAWRITNGARRFREHYILEGDDLYVCGWFRTLNHEGIEHERGAEVAARIGLWKRTGMPELLAEFDRNGDGELDPDEWQAVRDKAIKEIEREYRQRVLDRTPHLIHAPADGRPFIIGAATEPDLLDQLKKRIIVRSLLASGILAVIFYVLDLRGML